MTQRWRLTFARGREARELSHRDVSAAWNEIVQAAADAAAAGAALGAAVTASEGDSPEPRDTGKPRVAFAAPLPSGMTSQGELVDLILPIGRLTRRALLEVVQRRLPPAHRVLHASDVWVGEPSLPSLAVEATYAVDVEAAPSGRLEDPGAAALDAALERFLGERFVARPTRAAGRAPANLRALVVSLEREPAAPGPHAVHRLRMQLRLDPDLGSGRPEDVVEALAAFGPPLAIRAAERVGFVLREPNRRGVPSGPRPGTRLVRRSGHNEPR